MRIVLHDGRGNELTKTAGAYGDELRSREWTPQRVHDLCDSLGVKWDNAESFMELCENATDKRHLDDMNPAELAKIARLVRENKYALKSMQAGKGGTIKEADVRTQLQPHQQRVVDKITREDQPGLVVAHGLGSGKCVRGDTPVPTSAGLVQIKDLFGDQKTGPEQELFLSGAGIEVVSLDTEGTAHWTSVRRLYRQRIPKSEQTLVLTTRRGTIEVTKQHPLPIVERGLVRWLPAGHLKPGMRLMMGSRIPAAESELGLQPELVELLAWQVAEGWEHATKNASTITQWNTDVLERLQDCFRKVMPEDGSGHVRHDRVDIHSSAYRAKLESLGYAWGFKAADKEFPASWVTQLPEDQVRSLLRHFFDGEGSVDGCVELSSASFWLLTQIQYMLLRLGIVAAVSDKLACATNGTRTMRRYYRITLCGAEAAKFYDEVGFGTYDYKQEALREISEKKRNPNFGLPVGDLVADLTQRGISKKLLGICSQYETYSRPTVCKMVEALRDLTSYAGLSRLEQSADERSGTAGKWAKRSFNAVIQNQSTLIDYASRMADLLALPDVTFEPLAAISPGEMGGFVYDLEVDNDDWNEKNYLAGIGGFVVHNTLASIASQEALGMRSSVVVPAALRANYEKEREKHLVGHRQQADIVSYEGAVRNGAPKNQLLIADEAHRVRNPGTKANKALHGDFSKRLLLSASPFYNHPSDIAPLVNIASGQKTLPESKSAFSEKYVVDRVVKPSFLDKHLRHLKPGVVSELNPRSRKELGQILGKWVDYHPNSKKDFPSVTHETVEVPMTARQLKLYDTVLGQAPAWVAAKIRSGLPPSKQEAQDLNAFMSGVRQVSNTSRAYGPGDGGKHEEPKIEHAFNELKKELDSNPRSKAVVYSNFLESGVAPYRERLKASGIPFGEFTGEMNKRDRDEMVRKYNNGEIRALILSSAGGEGLDLKGTRLMQLLDPHWNEEKLKQVEGRGARYQSHVHLPEEERNVRVQNFVATRPRVTLLEKAHAKNPGLAADQYLTQMSVDKAKLNNQFRRLLEERSQGPAVPVAAANAPTSGLGKVASKETHQAENRARSHFTSDVPDRWETFLKNAKRKSFVEAVKNDPRSDAKLEQHVDQMNRLLTGTTVTRVKGKTGAYRIVKLRGSDELGCTCPDWRYKKSVSPVGMQACKHITEYQRNITKRS